MFNRILINYSSWNFELMTSTFAASSLDGKVCPVDNHNKLGRGSKRYTPVECLPLCNHHIKLTTFFAVLAEKEEEKSIHWIMHELTWTALLRAEPHHDARRQRFPDLRSSTSLFSFHYFMLLFSFAAASSHPISARCAKNNISKGLAGTPAITFLSLDLKAVNGKRFVRFQFRLHMRDAIRQAPT